MANVTQAELRRRTLEAMEDDLKISNKQAMDYNESLFAAIAEALEEGDRVSVFNIVNLKPAFRPSLPKRKAVDPRTGEEVTRDARPASVVVRASVPKKLKDQLPSPTSKAGKQLKEVYETAKAAREERAAEREAEAAKAERKAAREAKSGGKTGKKTAKAGRK